MVDPGLVVVDKAPGMTSHDVVARVRRLAGTRKVGHAGTLDPMATGVLVLGVERATRLLGHLMLTEKAYDATIRLGHVDDHRRRRGRGRRDPPTDGVTDEARTRRAGAVRRRHRAGADRRLGDQGRRQACLRPRAGGGAGRAQGTTGDRSTSWWCTRSCPDRRRGRRRTHLGAVLVRHLHPRDRAGPRRRAGRGRTPERAEAYGCRLLRPHGRPHARTAGGGLRAGADRRRRARVVRGRRAERGAGGGRPLRSRPRPEPARRGPHAVFAPDGEFLALYEQRGEQARAVAVFV